MTATKKKKAIYLSGGGARAAYQVGVLQGISDIIKSDRFPAEILSSVSAGSINAALLAMYADNFSLGITKLVNLWTTLSCDKIFYTSNYSLIKSVIRNISKMVFHYHRQESAHLLDSKPLKQLLTENLDFKKINANINAGLITDFEVAAACYDYPETVSFFKSTQPRQPWKRVRCIASPTEMNAYHILASAAIPLFFSAIKIDGLHYGDGGMRLLAPLRASIELGAEKLLIIGTRRAFATQLPLQPTQEAGVTFAKVLSNMLNSLFLDNLDRDVEVLTKINSSIENISLNYQSGWKKIEMLYIRPSKNLEKLAEQKLHVFPLLLRYLMSVFGSKKQSGGLISFLLFEAAYCKTLIEIGYADAMTQKNEIIKFFS